MIKYCLSETKDNTIQIMVCDSAHMSNLILLLYMILIHRNLRDELFGAQGISISSIIILKFRQECVPVFRYFCFQHQCTIFVDQCTFDFKERVMNGHFFTRTGSLFYLEQLAYYKRKLSRRNFKDKFVT